MILITAGCLIQILLIFELLLRRLLYLVIPCKRSAIQQYADTSALSALIAACLQIAVIPLQAIGSLILAVSRYATTAIVMAFAFAILLFISGTFVYIYSSVAKIYNTGIAPVIAGMRWVFMLADFWFRAVTPIYNAVIFLVSKLLTKIVVPLTFNNFDVIPDFLQALLLSIIGLSQTFVACIVFCQLT